jgi:leucine dehydrogenase
MTKRDVQTMGRVSKYIIGLSKYDGRPAYWTALSVFWTMERLAKHVWGTEGIFGRTIAIRGLGKVGLALAAFVAKGGGRVIGTDINPERVVLARRRIEHIRFVSPREIHRMRVNIFAPCALGGEFNEKTIRELKCEMICGGANNQLATVGDGMRLFRRNILYVPDYLVNAGGLIDVTAELDPKGVSVARIERRVREIPKTAERVVRMSEQKRQPTNVIADRMAEKRFLRKRK